MKLNRKKGILLLAAAMLILVCGVGGTLAYLVTQAGPVENKFEPGSVTSRVNEDFTAGSMTKSNVTITNTGNVSAYIRAAIVVTWQDANGNTMPQIPADTDYIISINTTSWEKVGDYYYYKDVVVAGGTTAELINSCTSKGTYDDGRKLCVEVIGSAIQAEGMGAENAQTAFSTAAN